MKYACGRCEKLFDVSQLLSQDVGPMICRECASGRREQQVQKPPAISPGFWKPLAIAGFSTAALVILIALVCRPAPKIVEKEVPREVITTVQVPKEVIREVTVADPQQAAELEKVKQERDNWKSLAGVFAKSFQQMKEERDRQAEEARHTSAPATGVPKQPDPYDRTQKDHEARLAEIERAYKARVAEIDAARKRIPAPEIPAVGAGDSAIESRIDGEFTGWEGETIFKLQNGQIWQQATYAYTYHYAYMPKVVIYRTGGSWKMKVEGVERTISVKRLK